MAIKIVGSSEFAQTLKREQIKSNIMKLEITTTGEKVEKVNYLISLAIDSAKENPAFLKAADLTEKDLDKIESFRKQMLKGYFKHCKG